MLVCATEPPEVIPGELELSHHTNTLPHMIVATFYMKLARPPYCMTNSCLLDLQPWWLLKLRTSCKRLPFLLFLMIPVVYARISARLKTPRSADCHRPHGVLPSNIVFCMSVCVKNTVYKNHIVLRSPFWLAC